MPVNIQREPGPRGFFLLHPHPAPLSLQHLHLVIIASYEGHLPCVHFRMWTVPRLLAAQPNALLNFWSIQSSQSKSKVLITDTIYFLFGDPWLWNYICLSDSHRKCWFLVMKIFLPLPACKSHQPLRHHLASLFQSLLFGKVFKHWLNFRSVISRTVGILPLRINPHLSLRESIHYHFQGVLYSQIWPMVPSRKITSLSAFHLHCQNCQAWDLILPYQ